MSLENRTPQYSQATISFVLLRLAMRSLLRGLFRIEVRGLDNLPTSGGYILAANHLSWIDAFIILSFARATPRIYFIAEKEHMVRPAYRKFFTQHIGGIIPVDRTSSSAYRDIVLKVDAVLKGGGVLGIFPEGTVPPIETGELLPLKKGLGNFAAKSGVPVVPVTFRGTKELWLRKHLIMTVGQPIDGKKGGREVASEQAELTASTLKALLYPPPPSDPGSPEILRKFFTELFS
jgi:1-acyl-sn-glycerol-3-phosphate acyltransferase